MTNLLSRPGVFRMILFGGPRLLLGEDVLPLSPLKGVLLGILYGREESTLGREELITLLWPEDDPRKARRRLNQLLYGLKTKTGSPPPFKSQGDLILKTPSRVSSDLEDFHQGILSSRLLDCVELLGQGFLRQVSGSVSRPFSNWVEERERELRSLLGRNLRQELQERESKADWLGARDTAEAISSLNPLDEGALRILMKARARVGGFSESERAYSDFVTRREVSLGSSWHPRPETRALLERIRSEIRDMSPGVRITSQDGPKEPRLVGRDGEHALLRRTLSNPPHHALRGILLTGEAGIGKTRLIRESVFDLALEGHAVFSADQAELEQMIPLNPLIEALGDPRVGDTLALLDDPWRAVLYGVMPKHFRGEGPIPQAPQIQPGSVPRRLFEAFHQLLLLMVEEAPLVLVVEDLQWADETTLSVLDFLFRRWDQGRLQTIVSLRSEEIGRNSPLRTFLDMLRMHEDFLEIPLGDLTIPASKSLINDISARPLSASEVSHLHSLAGGNPFFLIELTCEYLAGRVDQPSFPREILTIPLSIRQVLERRLAQLSPAAEKALGALSVHSKALRIEHLAKVAALSTSECMTGLDQLHSFRLVRSNGVEISVGHELIRRTVYQGLSSSRKAWLHEGLARHLLESTPNPPPDELAIHFHFAGSTDEALLFARDAAEKAEASGAIPEALRFLEIARENTNEPEEVADIIGRMGHLNYLHQNLEEAAPLLEVASQRFRRQGLDERALGAELERVDSLGQTGLLPFRECLEELERIKSEAKEKGYWETFMKALDVEAHKKELSGDLKGIREILRQAEYYARAGGPEAHCQAHAVLALNIYFGSPVDGLAAARRAVAIAGQTMNEDLLLHALNRLIIALHYQGMLNLQEGKETLEEAEKRLGTCGDLILKFFIRLNAAVWLLENGELARAVSAFETVETVILGTKAKRPLAMLNINLGELHLEAHEILQARERYRIADGFLSPNLPRFYRTIVNAGLGLCALHEGDLQEARIREGKLDPDPEFWTFDPTIVTIFRGRMLARRGNLGGAVSHLKRVRKAVDGRFISAWLRLLLEEGRVRRRMQDRLDSEEAASALEVCRQLSLNRRRDELLNLQVRGKTESKSHQ